MNDKRYLDSVGLQELVDWILLQLRTIKANQDAITDLLYKTDGTPGSIQQIVEEILKGKDITDLLQDDIISLYDFSILVIKHLMQIKYGIKNQAVSNEYSLIKIPYLI